MPHNDFASDGTPAGNNRLVPGIVPRWRFITLGRLALLAAPSGEEIVATQRRKLAVLAYLAMAHRPVERATLAEMFWGDEDDDRARHSLSNSLSYLRGIFGPGTIAVRRADVSIAADTPLQVDALELQAAASNRDHARVIELYAGAFFDGVYVVRSDSFEDWVMRERARLEGLFRAACDAECMNAARAADWTRCATIARRWLEVSPVSAEAALHLLNSLRSSRTPEGRRAAVIEYEALASRLRREYDIAPDQRVTELADRIAARAETDRVVATESGAHIVTTDAAQSEAQPNVPDNQPDGRNSDSAVSTTRTPGEAGADNQPSADPAAAAPQRRRRNTRFASITAGIIALVAVLVAGALWVSHRDPNVDAAKRDHHPLIVITDIANVDADTGSAWLEDGLSQMIAADVSRSSDVEVIAPTRVRDTRLRAELPVSGVLNPSVARDIARRLGGSIFVRGGFTHGPGIYALDFDISDVKGGRSLKSFSVTGSDPMALADAASDRILQFATANSNGPHFAEIETSNVLAYEHFVHALQAIAEGRTSSARRDLDAAIALDSGFAGALAQRAQLAGNDGDSKTLSRLQRAMAAARFTNRDLLSMSIDSAMHNGEINRAERLAHDLVAKYPHDPRSYLMLAMLYQNRGAWPEYEQTEHAELALDSLANEAGAGPCVPCSAYAALITGRTDRGDIDAAIRAARRWLTLQPNLPRAWEMLAVPLAAAGRVDAAIDADHRALLLGGNDPQYSVRLARDLLMARRTDEADSLARTWSSNYPAVADDAEDIEILALREHGQFRASIRRSLASHDTLGSDALNLEVVDAYGRLGEYDNAEQYWKRRVVSAAATQAFRTGPHGDGARWFTWTRANEGNAIAGAKDTLKLHALVDSLRRISPLSYYGRDWRLYNHLLGIIAMTAHRYAEAEHDFQAARWGTAGWTVTVAWLARAQLAQGHATAAISSLRDAYQAAPDAMGRYEPRSELDYLMALSFQKAGMPDSARVYGDYVRQAWRNADPEIKSQLAALTPAAVRQ